MTGRFTLKELKSALKYQKENYPWMYCGEKWIDDILAYDKSMDDKQVYTEWIPSGVNNDGVNISMLSNFAFLE